MARTEARSPRGFARLLVLAASSWGRAQLNAVFYGPSAAQPFGLEMTSRRNDTVAGGSGEEQGFDRVPVRDLAALLVAKSLLERDGIPYLVENASKHMTSPYPFRCPVIMVAKTRAQEARELLKLLSPTDQ